MEDLIEAMADFRVGPNCSPESCSNFTDCPAIRLGEKLHAIATSEQSSVTALDWGIHDWRTTSLHVQTRVEQLNKAVTACGGWDEEGKQKFEASSLCVSSRGLGKPLVLVDAVTATAATRAGLPGTVYLSAPSPVEVADEPEEKEFLRVAR